jgi:hypothetical protein
MSYGENRSSIYSVPSDVFLFILVLKQVPFLHFFLGGGLSMVEKLLEFL